MSALVIGAPAPEAGLDGPATIEARGNGCPGDSGQCRFHCINDVRKKCGGGTVLRPSSGKCGGPFWAVCKCIYSQNCP
ncbi:MAG: hypothetical protein M1833_003205 [Piccolia ochrophora]|nr:MAG: hypothetical protein M1833_003205 [Piccolia ochrophora]